MRILLVVTQLRFGGAETQVVQLARQFKASGHNVVIVSLMPALEMVDLLKNNQIELISLNLEHKSLFILKLLTFKSIIRQIKPDVIHAHLFHAIIFTRMYRLIFHLPRLICTTHGAEGFRGLRASILRWTDYWADLNTVVGINLLNDFLNSKAARAEKSRVVHNGVNLEELKAHIVKNNDRVANQLFSWLAVGRLVPAKDYPTLLKAIWLISQKRQDFKLKIAGDGRLKEELSNLTAQLDIEQYVEFLGSRSDVAELMVSSDAFVMSSAWEGVPMVLIEASLLGCSIVATDIGGNREVVSGSPEFCLVASKNPEELASAMLHMMSLSQEERHKIGEENARKATEKFNIKQICEQWLSLYQHNPTKA